jgi:hypothetical protein
LREATTLANGHQEMSYVDANDGERCVWKVEDDLRDVIVPPSAVAIARSETRRFKDYLDWIVERSGDRKDSGDGDVLLEMAARDISVVKAKEIVRWKRNAKAEWRELLAEFRTRGWAQKPPSDATIDATALGKRKEPRPRRAELYRIAVERLAYDAPLGWVASGSEVRVHRRLARAVKLAQSGDDFLAFECALGRLVDAFRRSFTAWRQANAEDEDLW